MQRLLEGGHNYERALALGMTTDSETSDDAMRLVDRMRQLARYPPVSGCFVKLLFRNEFCWTSLQFASIVYSD